MKTITISYFETGDIVECINEWRDWKVGDKAEVISTKWERESYFSNQYLNLKPIDGIPRGFTMMYAYNFKISE